MLVPEPIRAVPSARSFAQPEGQEGVQLHPQNLLSQIKPAQTDSLQLPAFRGWSFHGIADVAAVSMQKLNPNVA
jgi:hypothetical protein